MSNRSNAHWWQGVADLGTVAVAQSARRLEGVHLSIADESFRVLTRNPVTGPISRTVRFSHHNIARLCYRSVGLAADTANRAIRTLPVSATPISEE